MASNLGEPGAVILPEHPSAGHRKFRAEYTAAGTNIHPGVRGRRLNFVQEANPDCVRAKFWLIGALFDPPCKPRGYARVTVHVFYSEIRCKHVGRRIPIHLDQAQWKARSS